MKNKLAIIAGSGNLPLMLAQNHSGEVHVICIKDEANPELYEGYPKIILPLGKIQSLLEYLDNHEIKNLAIKAGISNKKYSCLPKFANLLKHESSAVLDEIYF